MTSIVSNIRTVVKRIRYFVTRTPAAAMDVLADTAGRIQTRMNVRKPKSDYPVDWDSEKQKRAFFATNGFGKGIPYTRTGDTVWTVEKPFTNEVDLFAPSPAGAVFGMPTANWWQSRIHGRTWPELRVVLSEELAKLPSEIFKRLKTLFNDAK